MGLGDNVKKNFLTQKEWEAYVGTAASCPAEVTFVIEIRSVLKTDKPLSTEKIPNANDTDRYPSAIGIPSVIPL